MCGEVGSGTIRLCIGAAIAVIERGDRARCLVSRPVPCTSPPARRDTCGSLHPAFPLSHVGAQSSTGSIKSSTMKRDGLCLSILCAAVLASLAARADDAALPRATPSVIVGGSNDVSVGGQGAARKSDTTDAAQAIVEGSSNVFINGKPAVRVGDRTNCGGIVVGGAGNVYVNGLPMARGGDLTAGCPGK